MTQVSTTKPSTEETQAPAAAPKRDLSQDLRAGDIEVLNGVIYGPPGSGKTWLLGAASKFEELRPTLVVTFDRMDPTLSKFDRNFLHVLDVPHQAKKANSTISKFIKTEVIKQLKSTKYAFVGLDNISKLLNPLVYREVLKDGIESAKRYGRFHDEELMEQQDYQRATVRVYDWLDQVRGLSLERNFHLFVVAREREEYIETGEFSGDYFYPDLPPELRRLVLHEFDFCYRLNVTSKVKKVEAATREAGTKDVTAPKSERVQIRRLYTVPRSSLVIKDRIQGLGDDTIDPTAKKIIDAGMKSMKAMHSPRGVED